MSMYHLGRSWQRMDCGLVAPSSEYRRLDRRRGARHLVQADLRLHIFLKAQLAEFSRREGGRLPPAKEWVLAFLVIGVRLKGIGGLIYVQVTEVQP